MESTYAAIARLVYTYAERLDSGDLAGMAGLFSKATLRTSGPAGIVTFTGSDEVHNAFANSVRRFEDGTPSTKHVTTNLIVDEDREAGTATGRAYFTVLQARPELALQVVAAGSYRDMFVLDADGWRFADRLIRIELAGDLSRHLSVALPTS
ncbi:nuclear transport factor 2 family protein [Dactylosporangium fulvum]|uniref:Nuclear transport factor 2 family protein n=1 Tax=Dactylosporangium fulvum TaxID=53359 RepID=A0ABY5W9J4_9ACTN|nr:nuclear transport factor 2 family protein [Dactylosporangium fulvum]UWP86725.1 nuclear transport factor 2 family protein [Dactylosporangium fulvum]